MSAIERRLLALEKADTTAALPWLTISRADRDNETQAIGFDGYPPRNAGEGWDAYATRAQQ